jgi:riboflavin kinase/FMN adenylyltransferase
LKGSIITIGTFDGVHLGHKKILQRLQDLKKEFGGETVVITFDPHPRKVLFPEATDLQIITDLREKLELLQNLRIDHIIVYPFTREFSQIAPEQFIREVLVEKLKMRHLVIGYDHKFGKNREGDINTFKRTATIYHFQVEEIPVQEINEINISSTKIRQALLNGEIELASSFLGHHFFLSGKVIQGKQLGRTLGYPTANISLNDASKLIPKPGVYLVKVRVAEFTGFGMMNIGTNPTVDNDLIVKIEVNIFNFDKIIYGEQIRVEMVHWIREEKKFNGLPELIAAIQEDEVICKQLAVKFK